MRQKRALTLITIVAAAIWTSTAIHGQSGAVRGEWTTYGVCGRGLILLIAK